MVPEKAIELKDELLQLQFLCSKAKTMMSDIENIYFNEIEPEETFLKSYYEEYVNKSSIAGDYLFKLEEGLKKFEKMLNE